MRRLVASFAFILLLLFSSGSFAAPTIVAGTGSGGLQVSSQVAGSTSYTAATTAATLTGDVFVLATASRSGTTQLSNASIGSDTCTASGGIAYTSGVINYCVIVTTTGYASSTNITLNTNSTSTLNYAIWSFRGISTGTPIDASGTKTFASQAATTTPSMTGNTLSNASEVLISFYAPGAGGTYTLDSGGWTVNNCSTSSCHAAYQIVSSTAAGTYGFTTTQNTAWGGFMLGIQALPSSTGGDDLGPLLGINQ